jgi:O-antigen ligase
MSPKVLYLGWGIVLIVYAFWPFGPDDMDQRVAFNLPMEYVPLLAVLTVGALVGLCRKQRLKVQIPKILWRSALGIILYGAISVLWIVDLESWLHYFFMWVGYLGLTFAMAYILSQESRRDLLRFMDTFLFLMTGFLAIVIVHNLVSSSSRFGTEEYGLWDFSPIIRYRISQIVAVLPFVPVATMLFFATRRITYLAFVASASLAILSSFSRDGAVGLAICLGLCWVTARWGPRASVKGLLRAAVIFVVLVLIAGTAAYFVGGTDLVERTASVVSILDVWRGDLEPGMPLWGRQVILFEAVRIFLERPFLGTGVGNYNEYLDPGLGDLAMSPHNLYLTYLSEFGILGFAPLLSFLISIAILLWNRARTASDPRMRAVLQGCAVAHSTFFVMFVATDFLVTPYVWFFWGLALAFVFFVERDSSSSPRGSVALLAGANR